MTKPTEFNLVVSFSKSPSPNYHRAIEIASKFNQFTPISQPGQCNVVTIQSEEFREKSDLLDELAGLIGSWRSTEYKLDGTVIHYHWLEGVRAVLKCSDARQRSSSFALHCRQSAQHEGWGCRFLSSVQSRGPSESWTWMQGRAWFSFGGFETPRIWKVHKDRIRDALYREAESKRLGLCPVFDFKKADSHLSSLPDTIDLDVSKEWVAKCEVGIDGKVMEERPISIEPASWVRQRPQGIDTTITFSDLISKDRPTAHKIRVVPDTRFSDIGGIDDILQKVREVIELPMEQPDLFTHLGIRPHRGVLLFGPPGCGKTLIAKAIANEVKAHFISIRGPELLSKWHGESEHNLRDVFDEAIDLKPSIIFFDEIDSLAQKRTSDEAGRIESRIVNQLLTLMDGMDDTSGLCVIASTNRSDLLDEALLRPGRFDYTLEVQKPNAEGCQRILEIHTRKMPLDKSMNLASFSHRLVGLSGADIAYLAREAGYCCIRRLSDAPALLDSVALCGDQLSRFVINAEDFEQALRTFEDKVSCETHVGSD